MRKHYSFALMKPLLYKQIVKQSKAMHGLLAEYDGMFTELL